MLFNKIEIKNKVDLYPENMKIVILIQDNNDLIIILFHLYSQIL